MTKKILFAGESWTTYSTHIKGCDMFYTSVYEEGGKALMAALKCGGFEVDYLPNHLAPTAFPDREEILAGYDCVILSDIGSNTLLLAPDTFERNRKTPNRCSLLKDYVLNGGALLMIGGYMSFAGIDAKARYGQTAIQDVLPVECFNIDDRVELPEGVRPVICDDSCFLKNLPGEWPEFLGYNRTVLKDGCKLLASINGDPFLATGEFGKGKSAAFTSDCSPHWGPQEFVDWSGYQQLWTDLIEAITQ